MVKVNLHVRYVAITWLDVTRIEDDVLDLTNQPAQSLNLGMYPNVDVSNSLLECFALAVELWS